ncbi:MAG: WecB/TagA/CpsF family glycosyltransferase [Myxococcota bacterium]
MDTVDVRGVAVGCATVQEWIDALANCVGGPNAHHHVSMNAAKWVALHRDPALRLAVRKAGSVGADGIGIVALAHGLGTPLPERAPGIDVARGLLDRARAGKWRVGLYGARPAIVEAVHHQLTAEGIQVVLAVDGYGPAPTEALAKAPPDLLLVALGTPRAEHFIATHATQWPGTVVLGVGGAFDVWAGATPRAPEWSRRWGLEWAARFVRSPRQRFQRAILDALHFTAAAAAGWRVPT